MEKLNDEQVIQMQKKMAEIKKQKYLDACKKRLENIITTKFKTTFIGAIDIFEKNFGFLWGADKELEDLTQEEIDFKDLFAKVRTDVLNLGNNQLRGAKMEIANQTISWNRYYTEFRVIGDKKDE